MYDTARVIKRRKLWVTRVHLYLVRINMILRVVCKFYVVYKLYGIHNLYLKCQATTAERIIFSYFVP